MRRLAKKVLAFFILCVSFYGCWVEKGKRPFDDVQSKADSGDFYYGGSEYDDINDDAGNIDHDPIFDKIRVVDNQYASKFNDCDGLKEIVNIYDLFNLDVWYRHCLFKQNQLVLRFQKKTFSDTSGRGREPLYDYIFVKANIMSGDIKVFQDKSLNSSNSCDYTWTKSDWFFISCEFDENTKKQIIFREGEWGTPWNYFEPLKEKGFSERDIAIIDLVGSKIIYIVKQKDYYIYDYKSKELHKSDKFTQVERAFWFSDLDRLNYAETQEKYFLISSIQDSKDKSKSSFFVGEYADKDLALISSRQLSYGYNNYVNTALAFRMSYDNLWYGFYDGVDKAYKMENWFTGEKFVHTRSKCLRPNPETKNYKIGGTSNGKIVSIVDDCNPEEYLLYDLATGELIGKPPLLWFYLDDEKAIVFDLNGARLFIHRLEWEEDEYAVFNYVCD